MRTFLLCFNQSEFLQPAGLQQSRPQRAVGSETGCAAATAASRTLEHKENDTPGCSVIAALVRSARQRRV